MTYKMNIMTNEVKTGTQEKILEEIERVRSTVPCSQFEADLQASLVVDLYKIHDVMGFDGSDTDRVFAALENTSCFPRADRVAAVQALEILDSIVFA